MKPKTPKILIFRIFFILENMNESKEYKENIYMTMTLIWEKDVKLSL